MDLKAYHLLLFIFIINGITFLPKVIAEDYFGALRIEIANFGSVKPGFMDWGTENDIFSYEMSNNWLVIMNL